MEDINILELKIHPIHLTYTANSDGNVIDLLKKRLQKIQTELNGYNTIYMH